jgi:hypothetical protein
MVGTRRKLERSITDQYFSRRTTGSSAGEEIVEMAREGEWVGGWEAEDWVVVVVWLKIIAMGR